MRPRRFLLSPGAFVLGMLGLLSCISEPSSSNLPTETVLPTLPFPTDGGVVCTGDVCTTPGGRVVTRPDAAPPPPGCGNGTPDPGEQCDEGPRNSDSIPDACRTNCQKAACGDGVIDTGEVCDTGGALSNTIPDACRLDCRAAGCGDSVVDTGEQCDDGPRNSDTTANACRTSCQRAHCGDGVPDTGEQCDTGANRSNTVRDACRLDCTRPRCGDGVVDTGESCDNGSSNGAVPGSCRADCSLRTCGDGRLDPGEQCDNGQANSDTVAGACRTRCVLAACGDGVRDPGEACDDGNRIDGDGCQNDCTVSQCLNGQNARCSDGVFCNGEEVCAAGRCQPGAPPVVDDGVGCTVDRCNEEARQVDHAPDDGACASLTTLANCATSGRLAGQLTRTVGVCNASAGCRSRTEVVQDCTAQPTPLACSGAELRRTSAICVNGNGTTPGRCDLSNDLQQACAAGVAPTLCTGSAAGGDLAFHANRQGVCIAATPRCDVTETVTQCAPRGATCGNAALTTYTATCGAGGCGNAVATTTSCPGQPSTCSPDNRTFTRYTPACNAAGDGCGPGTPTVATCQTRAPTCANAQVTTYAPSCTASGCGQPVANPPRPCPTQQPRCSVAPITGAPVSISTPAVCMSDGTCGFGAPVSTTCPGIATCSNQVTRVFPRCNPTTRLCDTTTETCTNGCVPSPQGATCAPLPPSDGGATVGVGPLR